MSSDSTSTALGEAQQRVITVKTDTGDLVRYTGNPAELPGARFETRKAMKRAGAFTLLIQHNACRIKGGTICVEHIDSIPIIAKVLDDPDQDTYTYEQPCPGTAARIARINATRALAGSNQHMTDISHGSLFATSGFERLRKEIPDSSMCTFANCRMGGGAQKYITFWYTNDAARVL